MNAERLLAHYERIADAPAAIGRLRRFILDLAVRGKLVPQDPKDEPASELLKRIAKEKARLITVGKCRDKPAHPAVAHDEMPFDVPAAWRWVRFTNIADFSAGRTPSRNDTSFWNNGDHAWVSIADMQDGQILTATKETVTNKARQRVFGSEPEAPGTIIMSFKLTIGKIARLGIPAFHNEAIISIRPHLTDLDAYMFMVLPQFARLGDTKGAIKGATLNRDSIANILFPLPPLAEQHRIVGKVDELMGLCDRLEAARAQREATRDRLTASSLARLNAPDPETFQDDARFVLNALPALTTRPDQIKQLRQTILNLAVRGKLVPQDSKDEPASELLKRLKTSQIAACSSEGLRARPPVTKLIRADIWFEFPESWALSSFDELFVIVSGVTKGQKVSTNEAVDAAYLRVANVQRGYLDLSVVKKITVRKDDLKRYVLRLGDVLMTEGGDWDKLGRAAIWREEVAGCIHQNHIFRVRPPSGDVSPEWVITYVNSLLGRAFFEDASKQTTNLASINMTQLRGCPLPLPPLAEQHRIVAKVDELMAICDQLEASLTDNAATRRRLLDALLAEALTPAEVREVEAVA